MKSLYWGVVLILLLAAHPAHAQWSNLHQRTIDARVPLLTLDTLLPYPSSLMVVDSATGRPLPPAIFHISGKNLHTDTTALRANCPDCRRLQVTWRAFSFDLSRPVFRLDSSALYRYGRDNDVAFDYAPYNNNKSPGATQGLQSSGAYTRGLSLGNSQNLVFNSNLNLQLEGKLGNDLQVRAAMTDNSAPLQPDGTTQRLQEFDRIYIEIEHKNQLLTAGDLDFTRPGGYFSQYFKRMQGAKLALKPQNNLPGGWIGAGISKGKFNRQTIQGQEGNQGPYRLQGAEGERFIIVLAGTEKVYADGKLLQRGLTDEYTIDYNLGEVTFTSKKLMTKDIRIIIEFEYAVQNYLRSTLASHGEWEQGKGTYWFNFYSEQDGLNSGGNLDLSPEQRRQLALAGDQLANAYTSGIDTLTEFDAGRVLYESRDTAFCSGEVRSILVQSSHPEKARYAARFTEVPQGQGNYVLANSNVNGRVYRWVAPDPVNCRPTGNFEPVIRLIAPEQKQLHTLGGRYKWGKRTTITAETAMSRNDLNRFSPIGNDDNNGWGASATIQRQSGKWHGWSLRTTAEMEWINATFKPLNPYRPAEFVRDWNTGSGSTAVAERLIKGTLELSGPKGTHLQYDIQQFQRKGQYNGLKHNGKWIFKQKGWELTAEFNDLNSHSPLEQTHFSRPKGDISYWWKNRSQTPLIQTGLYAERERNRRSNPAADTLLRTSFWYDLAKIYWNMPGVERRFNTGGYLSQRTDYTPGQQDFILTTTAYDANLNGNLTHKAAKRTVQGTLDWNVTWRQLRINATEHTTLQPQETWLGRVDYRFSALKNGLNLTTGYELGSGQTPKMEYNYLMVNPGEGQYAWIDRNQDSILQVDEMEIAVFQDQARYIRVAVSTPQYVRTNNAVFNQSLRIEPRLWMPTRSKGIRETWRRIALQSTLQIQRRVLADAGGVSPWNPFQLDIADTALITVSSTTRHALYINRADPKWDISLSQGDNQSRVLATTGFERRSISDQTMHFRLNFSRKWSVESDVIRSLRANNTENFLSRNYHIPGWEAGPKLTWMPARVFRLSLRWSWKTRDNTLSGAEHSRQNDWNTELTWNPSARARAGGQFRAATSLRAGFKLASIQYEGVPNTPVSFAMLEGLQSGRNLLWNMTLDRQLSKSVQLNVSYEGRRTGTAQRLVHTGRAQVRAIF